MLSKILIANWGGRAAGAVAPATNCLVREAHAGDLTPMEAANV